MDAAELHQHALVVDTHNDTIVAHMRRGHLGFFERGPIRADAAKIQIDFPLMHTGGIDLAFFAIDVTAALGHRLAYALDGFGYLLTDIEGNGNEVTIVRTAPDIERARAAGRPAALLAVEHADVAEDSLYVLRALYEIGVRSIGLTHNISSRAADGCLEARDGVGLTRFGVALVREMNALGMVVDLAHVSPSAFLHALEVSEKPVIFSHGNARALCDHPRNLDDEQLTALAENGGVIGMSFVPAFVDTENPSLDRLLDHIEHVCEIAGPGCLGLGSDFDGGGTLLSDATAVPRITAGLLDRGFDEPAVRMILGENTLRVLNAVL